MIMLKFVKFFYTDKMYTILAAAVSSALTVCGGWHSWHCLSHTASHRFKHVPAIGLVQYQSGFAVENSRQFVALTCTLGEVVFVLVFFGTLLYCNEKLFELSPV